MEKIRNAAGGGRKPLMYPFLTLDDETEIVHSQMLSDGKVNVYIEKSNGNQRKYRAKRLQIER